jgi:periplasmic protein TonB
MDVTDVLRDRAQAPEGLQRMVVVSIVGHAVLITALLLAPATWLRRAPVSSDVMRITLGGSSGPSNGGMSSIGGRPVQTAEPPPKRPEAVRPPATSTPKMTLPTQGRQTAAHEPTPERPTPPQARGRTPTRGAEVTPGTSLAETGARGMGFGLATGGGAGAGVTLDVGNFCCPEYVATMVQRVRANWESNTGVAAETIIHFAIQRDGRLTDITVAKSSGDVALDLGAEGAVARTKTLPPLPAEYPNQTLGVNLTFQYTR